MISFIVILNNEKINLYSNIEEQLLDKAPATNKVTLFSFLVFGQFAIFENNNLL